MKKPKKVFARPRFKCASRLTSKFQSTIPKEIRTHLHLKSGDEVLYELLQDNTVTIRKVLPLDRDFYNAQNKMMNEWETPEDENAYRDL